MSIDFWLSVLVAIPLAIAANLLTPALQRWWEHRSKSKALNRKTKLLEQNRAAAERMKKDLARISALREDRAELQIALTVAVLKATLIGALTAMAAGLMFAYANIPRLMGSRLQWLAEFSTVAGQLLSLMGSLLVFHICNKAVREYTRVRNFDEFRASTERELVEIERKIEEVQ